MAGHNTNRKKDYLIRQREFNTAPFLTSAEIKASILEMRRIYSSLTDHEFAAFYNKKYRLKIEDVLRVLEANR